MSLRGSELSCFWWKLSVALIAWGTAMTNATPAQDSCRVLFGSCIRQDQPMPILRLMASRRSDRILLLGDNIYGDTDDAQVLRAKYQLLADNPDFQSLRRSAPILAVWDDHDFGLNDGGSEYAGRDDSQQAFLDFWGIPAASPRRTRQGVYHSEILQHHELRVQVILLDARFHRTPLMKGERRTGGPYYPRTTPDETMLGDVQWRWLETQLRIPADVRLIGCGIQMIAEAAGQETWSNMPAERQRLFQLIQQTRANGVLLLSGDRHWAELSVERELSDYPIYEVTSSSLNQKHSRGTPTQNSRRASPITWHEENFGQIDLKRVSDAVEIEFSIVNLSGETVLHHKLISNDLKP